jgi:hypothetical protein
MCTNEILFAWLPLEISLYLINLFLSCHGNNLPENKVAPGRFLSRGGTDTFTWRQAVDAAWGRLSAGTKWALILP